MNQDYNNQGQFNNNVVPEQTPINEQPMMNGNFSNQQINYSQPINNYSQMNIPPENKKQNKNVIIVIALISLVVIGVILYFVLFNKKESSNDNKTPQKTELDLTASKFSSSTDINNITFTFYTREGYYALKLNGDGYGKSLKMTNEKIDHLMGGYKTQRMLSNDSIKIYMFSTLDKFYYLHDFFNCELLTIKLIEHNNDDITGTKVGYSYTTNTKVLENYGNMYLVEEEKVFNDSKYENEFMYYIYIIVDDYDFKIAIGEVNKDKTKEVFDKLKDIYEICYMTIDQNNITKITKTKNSNEIVDTSNWTFASDLIQDYYLNTYKYNIRDARLLRSFNCAPGAEPIIELSYDISKKVDGSVINTTVRSKIGAPIEDIKRELEDPRYKVEKIEVPGYKEAYLEYEDSRSYLYLISNNDSKITIRIDMGTFRNKKEEILEFIKQGI